MVMVLVAAGSTWITSLRVGSETRWTKKGVVVLKNNSDITAYLGLRYVKVLCGIFRKLFYP